MTLALIVHRHRQRRPAARRGALGPGRRRAAAAVRLAGDAAVVPDHRPRGAPLSDRAPMLDRHPWIYAGAGRAAAPMLVISLRQRAFLLGVDGVLAAAGLVRRRTAGSSTPRSPSRSPPTCSSSSRALIATARNLDGNERRRIQIVVLHRRAGGVRLRDQGRSCRCCQSLAGRPVELPLVHRERAAGDRPAAGVRAAVRGRRQARVQPAHGAAPQPAVRAGAAHALGADRAADRGAGRSRSSVSAIARSATSSSGSRCSTSSAWRWSRSAFATAIRRSGALDKQFFRAEYDAREILVVARQPRAATRHDPRKLVAIVLDADRRGAAPRSDRGAGRRGRSPRRGVRAALTASIRCRAKTGW